VTGTPSLPDNLHSSASQILFVFALSVSRIKKSHTHFCSTSYISTPGDVWNPLSLFLCREIQVHGGLFFRCSLAQKVRFFYRQNTFRPYLFPSLTLLLVDDLCFLTTFPSGTFTSPISFPPSRHSVRVDLGFSFALLCTPFFPMPSDPTRCVSLISTFFPVVVLRPISTPLLFPPLPLGCSTKRNSSFNFFCAVHTKSFFSRP